MPYPSDIKYPAVATNAAWQKKKATVDKLVKTKVGPALVAAEAKWKAIDFADLKVDKVYDRPAQAEYALDKAKKAWPAVLEAKTAVAAALKLAKTQSTNTKLSSASRTALKAIATALDGAHDRLDRMDDIIPLLSVDVRNTNEAARKDIKNLELKDGNKILAHAKAAKLQTDGSYEVTEVTWAQGVNALNMIKKKVQVSAHDAFDRTLNLDATIAGVKGNDELRLK